MVSHNRVTLILLAGHEGNEVTECLAKERSELRFLGPEVVLLRRTSKSYIKESRHVDHNKSLHRIIPEGNSTTKTL